MEDNRGREIKETLKNISADKSFVKNLLIFCVIVTLLVLVLWGGSYVIDVLMMTFAAILIAILLNGLGNLIRRYVKISEPKSVLLVSFFLLLLLAGFVALLAPDVGDQAKSIRQQLPASIEQIRQFISQYGWGRTILENLPTNDEVISKINDSGFLTRIGGVFSSTLGVLANVALVLLVAVYLAIEPDLYTNGLTKLFPFSARQRVKEVLGAIGKVMQSWLLGKAASMTFIGILTWIGLSILGIPMALSLGLLAGLLSFIPNFGPILSALPAILLAFIDSPIKAVYVAILFIVVQLIESNIVTPYIERQTVELPPALTIVVQIISGVLFGVLGLIFASPLLAVVVVLVKMLYIEDVLGDSDISENIKEAEREVKTEENSDDEAQLKDEAEEKTDSILKLDL